VAPVPVPLLIAVLALGLFLLPGLGVPPACARITSHVCYDCHTMHNSEGGQPQARMLVAGQLVYATVGNPALTRGDCGACHTNASSGQTIIPTSGGNTPIVFNTVAPSRDDMLAGGNFHWTARAGQSNDDDGTTLPAFDNRRRGHTLESVSGLTDMLPPGSSTSFSRPLTCSGSHGCHGDPLVGDEYGSMRGTHHGDDGTVDGTTIPKSYRFLMGVKGVEDPTWERDATTSAHNEYAGGTGGDSISSLCGRCHGIFHDPARFGSSSPWQMHPTDVVLPSGNPSQVEYAGYTTYNPLTPVGRPPADLGTVNHAVVRPGQDYVICLSCHRAHGSPYWKGLRWNYRANYQSAYPGEVGGCATCHTHKD